jgi:hypothetical protein
MIANSCSIMLEARKSINFLHCYELQQKRAATERLGTFLASVPTTEISQSIVSFGERARLSLYPKAEVAHPLAVGKMYNKRGLRDEFRNWVRSSLHGLRGFQIPV